VWKACSFLQHLRDRAIAEAMLRLLEKATLGNFEMQGEFLVCTRKLHTCAFVCVCERARAYACVYVCVRASVC
jgi:hypothetical protein